ncbi:DUF4352 domain-containing protein [Clostridium sp.]|uniref:DUF4352 domain-containing protein n=1 Tax=Clostridium sp. TaxID=1506 RepID=UPI003D6D5712
MLRKITNLFIIVIISILALTGCGASSSNSSNSSSENTTPLSKTEFAQLYSDSSKFEGRRVCFYARIFTEPKKDDKGTYLQAYANDDHSKKTIIGLKDPELGVKNGDIIEVSGIVGKAFEGENPFGVELTAPSIAANEIERSDYSPAFAPAIKTIQINKEINQNGYILKLNKIEVAEKETRLFININNTTKDKISFYSLNTNITQGNKQFKELVNLNEKVPEIDSHILPGVAQDGVLIFEPIQEDGENLKVIFEGESDNQDLHFIPFTFGATCK